MQPCNPSFSIVDSFGFLLPDHIADCHSRCLQQCQKWLVPSEHSSPAVMHVVIQGWLVMPPELVISLERQLGRDLVQDVHGESGDALLRYGPRIVFLLWFIYFVFEPS
jgi:hypothetical protein